MGSQRVGHDWATFTFQNTILIIFSQYLLKSNTNVLVSPSLVNSKKENFLDLELRAIKNIFPLRKSIISLTLFRIARRNRQTFSWL